MSVLRNTVVRSCNVHTAQPDTVSLEENVFMVI
jgi:hypothetical protein